MKHTTTALALLLLSSLFTSCKKEEDDAPAPIAAVPCTYTVGAWSAWEDGVRTRTVTASPLGCEGTMPATQQIHPCLSDGQGFISIRNNTANVYSVNISGTTDGYGPVTLGSGGLLDSIPLNTGNYSLSALQLTGYVVTPTVYNATTALGTCEDRIWNFP